MTQAGVQENSGMKRFFDMLMKVYLYYYSVFMILLTLDFMPDALMSAVNLGSMAAGTVLVIYVLFTVKPYKPGKPLFIPFLLICFFFLSYALTIAVNAIYGLTDNVKAMVTNGIQLMLLFFFFASASPEKAKSLMRQVMLSLVVMTFAIAAANLTIAILGIQLRTDYPRFMGIYNNPNNASVSALSVVCSVYILQFYRKYKWFLLVNIALQVAVNVLCESRGAFAMLAVTAYIYATVFLVERARSGKARRAIVLSSAAIAAVLACLSVVYVLRLVNNLLALDGTVVDYTNPFDKLGSSSVRLNLIRCGIGVFLQHPVFGVGPRNIILYVVNTYPTVYLYGILKGGLHNAYLSLLVGQGVVGVAAFFAFAADALRRIFASKSFHAWYNVAILAGIAVLALFEVNAFFVNFPTSFLFWSVLGYTVNIALQKKAALPAKA